MRELLVGACLFLWTAVATAAVMLDPDVQAFGWYAIAAGVGAGLTLRGVSRFLHCRVGQLCTEERSWECCCPCLPCERACRLDSLR